MIFLLLFVFRNKKIEKLQYCITTLPPKQGFSTFPDKGRHGRGDNFERCDLVRQYCQLKKLNCSLAMKETTLQSPMVTASLTREAKQSNF